MNNSCSIPAADRELTPLDKKNTITVRVQEESDLSEVRAAAEHIRNCLKEGLKMKLCIEHVETGEGKDVPEETMGMFATEITELIGQTQVNLITYIPSSSKLGKERSKRTFKGTMNDGSAPVLGAI